MLYALNKVRTKATQLYPKYKTDTRQYKHWYSYWHDFAANNLYGIEISEQISRAAKGIVFYYNFTKSFNMLEL